jgi:ubiquinone/menaquinone biosynthesis C-methylase UbiE
MPTKKRSSRTSRFYSRIGNNGWHESDYFTFSVRSAAFRRWIASQMPEKGMKILSIGCGTGELENHLSELRHHVVGLDMSRQMLERARDSGLKLLVHADAQFLPFSVDSFDVVMFMESVGYLHMPTAFIEAWRVLKKHGRLLTTTYSNAVRVHSAYTKFCLNEIASSLSAAGFRVEDHRFLDAKRTSVVEVPSSEDASTLLYVLSTKQV